jgi:hypothetical protein
MLTVRLDNELEIEIKNVAKNMHISKSELVRKSVVEFIKQVDKPSPWQLGKEVFGKYASDNSTLAEDRKKLVRAKISAKT